jgi:hypothetical protein
VEELEGNRKKLAKQQKNSLKGQCPEIFDFLGFSSFRAQTHKNVFLKIL